jgi:serine/threonine protein kinase
MKSCPTCKSTYPADFTLCPKDGATLRSTTELEVGAIIRGKYEVLAKLGEGGMGAVYKVRNVHFDEVGALKIVSTRLLDDTAFLQRFRSEALVMRRLAHPHAVRVQDFDETDDGRPFMVMEYVEGRSLDSLLAEGPLAPSRAVHIAMQACEALEAAHRLGIIHRDIKPSNIMVSCAPEGGDTVKVFDFGIAKIKEGSKLRAGASLTQTGFVVGTPAYMSPEQCQGLRGERLDGRTDLYSLGIVLFEALTGRVPFQAESSVELLMAHIQAKPPDPREIRAELPPELVSIVLQALEKDPAKRFGSAEEMRRALQSAQEAIRSAVGETVAVLRRPTMRGEPVPAPSGATAPRTPVPGVAELSKASIPAPTTPSTAEPAVARPPEPAASLQVDAPAPRRSAAPWLYAVAGGIVVLVIVVVVGLMLRKPLPPSSSDSATKTNAAVQPVTPPPSGARGTPGAQAPSDAVPSSGIPSTPSQKAPRDSLAGDSFASSTASGGSVSNPSALLPVSAQGVYQRYFEALGGVAAFDSWKSYSANGLWQFTDEGKGQSVSGTFEISEQTPNQFLQTAYAQNQLVLRQGFDGKRGWKQEGTGPVQDLTQREVVDILRDSNFFRLQHADALYSSMRLAGKDTVSGRPVDVIQATPPSGEPDAMYFESDTGLLLRRDTHAEIGGVRVPVQKYYEDYRPTCGARMAWTERQLTRGVSYVFRITQLRCNVALGAATFAPPASSGPGATAGGFTGQFQGVVRNLSTQVSANFSVVWEDRGGPLAGCMVVQQPLSGSGPLEGAVQGDTVRFRVAATGATIDFEGIRTGETISGAYVVIVSGVQAQRGQFVLQKRSGTLPQGFSPARCATD